MKCCKCSNSAEYKVVVSGRTYLVCEEHIPTQGESCDRITDLDILRANKHICNLQGKEYILSHYHRTFGDKMESQGAKEPDYVSNFK